MNTYTSHHRFYRTLSTHTNEISFQVVVEETDLHIVCEKDLREAIFDHVHTLRGQIKGYMHLHPTFLTSLTPLPSDPHAPALVSTMLEAAQTLNVGPMAAVAGAIAQNVADTFSRQNKNILVENGGDIYMHSSRKRTIGLLADPSGDMALGLALTPGDFPCAVCSSSAGIGHSLSLGKGDLVVVRARTGALADAAATRFCNELGSRRDIQKILGMTEDYKTEGMLGVLAQCEGNIGITGAMELVGLTG